MHKNKTLRLWLPTGYPCLSQASYIITCFLFTMDSLLSFELFPVVSQELFSVHYNNHVPPVSSQTGLQEDIYFTCAQSFAKTGFIAGLQPSAFQNFFWHSSSIKQLSAAGYSDLHPQYSHSSWRKNYKESQGHKKRWLGNAETQLWG